MTPAFEELIKQTAKKFADKKAPKNPETQWRKGAEWMYDLLTGGKTVDLLRQQLKADVMNREGVSEVEPWKLSLIDELADMLAEKMAMQAEIREQGRLLQKWDKNMNPYYESNPLYVHIKAKEQSISVWRDKLGLSNTVNPDRIKQDAKRGVDTEKDGLSNLLTQARDTMNEIPEMD
jgi:hypothetical protein